MMERRPKKAEGFLLIEAIVFIIVTSLILTTLLISAQTALLNAPQTHHQWTAMRVAEQCLEWYLDQRRIVGYASLTCPSSPTPTACSAPAGFAVNTSIACTSWNGDSNYKTITVAVTGAANITLEEMVGSY